MMMARARAWLALAGAAATVNACVYDPYRGVFVPCCHYYGYPYGYYGYPPYYGPYGYPPGPYGAPQQPGGAAYPANGGSLQQRFAAANVTHDGRLTREQAQAGMPLVAQNFDSIDVDRKGYVTLPEVQMFLTTHRAELGGPAD